MQRKHIRRYNHYNSAENEESFSRQKTSRLRTKGKVEVMDKSCQCSSNKDHTLLSVTVCYHGEISTKLRVSIKKLLEQFALL